MAHLTENMQQHRQWTSGAGMAALTLCNLSRPSLLVFSAGMSQCGIGMSNPELTNGTHGRRGRIQK